MSDKVFYVLSGLVAVGLVLFVIEQLTGTRDRPLTEA